METWITLPEEDDEGVVIEWELLVQLLREVDASYGADADGNRGTLLIEYDHSILDALKNGHQVKVDEVPASIVELAIEQAISDQEGKW